MPPASGEIRWADEDEEMPSYEEEAVVFAPFFLNGNTYTVLRLALELGGLRALGDITTGELKIIRGFEYDAFSAPFNIDGTNFIIGRTSKVRRLIDMDNGYVTVLEIDVNKELIYINGDGTFTLRADGNYIIVDSNGVPL